MKKFICCMAAFLLFFTTHLFAEDLNPYKSADNETKTLLDDTDKLIENKQYKSAFERLPTENKNEYIIAKKIEICDNYFATTLMHQTFAFKDLEKDETLDSVRSSNFSGNMVDFDPVKIVADFETKNGASAILEKSLGDYYMSVYTNYEGNWLLEDKEVINNCYNNYLLSYNKDCYDTTSLANFGYMCLATKDFTKAIEVLNKELTYKEDPNIHYNLALALINTGDNKQAAPEAQKAALSYKNLDYKIDAYLLCAEAFSNENSFDEALKQVDTVLAYSENDYRAYDEYVSIYLKNNNFEKAGEYADKLFALAPEKPAATQMVFSRYFTVADDELEKFFVRNLETYKDKPAVLGNLNYHFAYFYFAKKNKDKAVLYGQQAKQNFIDAELYQDETKQAIDEMLEAVQSN